MRHAPTRQLVALRLAVGVLGLVLVVGAGWYYVRSGRSTFTAAGILPVAEAAPGSAGPLKPATTPPGSTPDNAPMILPTPIASGFSPQRLQIADLDINNPVVPVQVVSGVLQVPELPNVIGWWARGAAVGSATGATVLAAHVDSKRYGTGVFSQLKDIPIGTIIKLGGGGHADVTYVVRARRSYLKADLPYQALFAQTGVPRLVLITCNGEFDRSIGHYKDNIVVVATPV
jgi:hypothetical protein